jgi:hypothetical protein
MITEELMFGAATISVRQPVLEQARAGTQAGAEAIALRHLREMTILWTMTRTL